MTATQKRHRRWLWTGTMIGGLTIGSGICGAYRSAHAQSGNPSPVPVVVLPSAQPVVTASLTEPPPLPRVERPNPRLQVQAPELLPLPLPVPEKAPAAEKAPTPPRPKLIPDVKPIENPMPVAPPLVVPPLTVPTLKAPKPAPEPTGFPVLPPLTQPLQPAQPAEPSKAPPIPPPVLRLHPLEPGNNVKSSEPLSPLVEKTPLPTATLTSLPHTTSTPGEPPMPLSLRRTALSALLGTALVAGTMYADNDPPKTESATKKDLETTNQLLADLKKELAELKTKDLVDIKQQLTSLKAKDLSDIQREVNELKLKNLAEIKKDIDTLKDFKKKTQDTLEGVADKGAGGDGLLKKMTALDDKLATLTKQIESLDKKLETTRTALSSPVNKEPAKEKPKIGTVKIVNMYATDVDVIVNGKGYRVAPNESKSLALNVGTFTYQLLTGGGEEKSRGLKEGEEVTLLVNN